MDINQISEHVSIDGFSAIFEQLRQAAERSAQKKGELPQVFPSRDAQILAFTMNKFRRRLSAEAIGNSGIYTLTTEMPPSYRPCTRPLSELEPMLIKDMRLETHHRRRKVFLRVITPHDRLNAVMAIAEDTSGLTVLLQIYHLPKESTVPAELTVHEGRTCVVKEPFFKATTGGVYSLRVDHVNDIVWLPRGDTQIPNQWKSPTQAPTGDSLTLRSQGNEAVKKEEWAKAAHLYTSAIQTAQTDDEVRLARLNRSLTYLKLGRFEESLADAAGQDQASLEKGLFREGRALYELGKYEDSLAKFLTISELFPENKAYKPYSKLAQERIAEAQHGNFCFARMYAQASKPNPIIDCATFSKPVEVRDSPGRGRGLFTTRAVSAGDLLLCEKAMGYCYVAPGGIDKRKDVSILMQLGSKTGYVGGQAQLISDLVQKLQHNPVAARPLLDLHQEGYGASSVQEVDGRPVVDTFRVMRTITANCFGAPQTSLKKFRTWITGSKEDSASAYSTCGVWILASRINHSCLANCRRSFIGDMQIIRATTEMPEGTELMFPYKAPEPLATYEEAQGNLQSWHFKCKCAICLDKKATTQEALNTRTALLSRLKRCLTPTGRPTTVHVHGARGILEQIDATYKKPRSPSDATTAKHFVPRLALWNAYWALGSKLLNMGKPSEAVTATVKGLEALGFAITAPAPRRHQPSGQSTVLKVNSWGLVNEDVPAAFLALFRAYRSTNADAAVSAREYLKIAYQIVVGESETVLQTFPELGSGVQVQ